MRYQIGKYLEVFLNDKNLSITDLANRLGLTHAYVSYIKNSKKTASKNFLEKFVKEFKISSIKSEELFEMLKQDKKIEKLKLYESKKREVLGTDSRIEKLTKRERMQLDEILNSANFYYNDKNVSEEDKKKLHDTLQEIFFDAKAKNKRKK